MLLLKEHYTLLEYVQSARVQSQHRISEEKTGKKRRKLMENSRPRH